MTNVKTWQHGDAPTAADLNAYGTALTEAHSSLGDAAVQLLCLKSSEAVFTVRHTHRYLHFTSNGQLVDPTGVNEPTGLSEESGAGKGVLDLETVGWLGYGSLYWVTGVSACLEDWDA